MDSARVHLIAEINQAFTPGAPIDSRDLFAGRSRQLQKVIGTIFQRGQHVVIFGERGVGKTSLANTIYDSLILDGKYTYQRARLNCSDGLGFEALWYSIFKQFSITIENQSYTLDQYLPTSPISESIRETFQAMDGPSIVIIDELDRVTDRQVQVALADTIKTLSDNSVNTTLILVGVADSIGQLITEHHSIERAIVQVPIPRMSKTELLEIVDKGLSKCDGLRIDSQVRERLADYSQGLPSYTHLLTREAAQSAAMAGRSLITMDDLNEAIKESVDSQLETHRSAYNVAVTSPRGKNFRPVLLACALARKEDHGYFYANNVTQPLRSITNRPYNIPAFARHLKDFCNPSRGPVLESRGKPNKTQYRFVKPLMEPYVILRGLADGLITEEQLSHPSSSSSAPEQLSLKSAFDAPGIEV